MNFVQSISIPESELLKTREIVLGSLNAEVALLLFKSGSGSNGVQVPIKRIIQLHDIDLIPGGDGIDFTPTTVTTIHNIKNRVGLSIAGMGHSHLLRHPNHLSGPDKRVIEGQQNKGGNQVNMLFKIDKLNGSYTVLAHAYNNLCDEIPIDVLDKQGNFIKRMLGKPQTSSGTRSQPSQKASYRREDLMPPGGFGVPPSTSFWQKIFGKK